MAEANANIRIDVDTSAALANIKNLQRQISMFHSQMAQGGAKAAAASAQMSQSLVNSINATKGFSAQLTTINSSSQAFTAALEKNQLSMGQYFRFAGASTKTFGKLFKTEFNTINKVARERVKDLQTQYVKLGRNASGAINAIKVRPQALDMQNFGTQTAMAAQRVQLFNQLLRQGSTNLLNWGKNTQWAGRQLMVGFTVPLTIFGTIAAREFQKLEEQAIKFRRVYGDMFTTDTETEKALKDVRELANEFTKYGIAVEKTVDLAAKVAQMGNVGAALETQVIQATRLSVLGGMEQMDALDTTISLTNAFKIEIQDLAKEINFLNAAENQTILAIEDFNTAIPLAGSVVKQLGGDVQDLAVLLTAMREGGINASQAGNALKSSLARLVAPSRNAKEVLGEFGIDVMGIVDSNAGNLMGTINTLAHSLKELDPLSNARAIEALFGKFQFARMSTLFANIVDEGSQANKVLGLTVSSARELQILADRELGKVEESSATRFSKSLEQIKAELAPIGEEFLKAVTPIVQFVSKILERFNQMGDGAKQFIVVLGAIGGVIAPALLMVVGLIANGIANLIKFVALVGRGLGAATSSSKSLGDQTNYLTQQQVEQLSVSSSLDQVHSSLAQTFTAQADAVANLVVQYDRAIQKQREFSGYGGAAAGGVAGAAGGVVRGYANGVMSVPGPTGAGDVVPAMLSPGEAVIPTKVAKKYRPLIQGIIADNIPGFINGTPGVAMEKMHVGGQLPHTDQIVNTVSNSILPGFKNLAAEFQQMFQILGDLVAVKSQELNQAAKEFGKFGGKDFSDPEVFKESWNVNEGQGFVGTAERAITAGQLQDTPEVRASVETMDLNVRDLVAEKLPEITEAEKAVEGWLDRLIEAATTQVIDTMAQSGTESEQRVASAMKDRKAMPVTARTTRFGEQIDPETGQRYGTADRFVQKNIERGNLEKRPGQADAFFTGTNLSAARPEYGKGETKIARQAEMARAREEGTIHNLPMRASSLSRGESAKFSLGGMYETGPRAPKPTDPEFKIQPATDVFVSPESAGLPSEQAMAEFGVRNGDAYSDGLQTSSKDAKDVGSAEAGRGSPHPEAFQDGADDAQAYLDGQQSVLGAGADPFATAPTPSLTPDLPGLAPPPAPTTPAPAPRGVGGKIMDKFGDSPVGQAIGKKLAQASGNALTDSQGNVTFDPNQDPTTWAGQMEMDRIAQTEAIKEAAREQVEAASKLDSAGQDLAQGAQELEQGSQALGDAAMKQDAGPTSPTGVPEAGSMPPRRGRGRENQGRGGITGRGVGLSMGLGALSMASSMAPGALGEQAQKMQPALMALSSAPMLIQALQNPLIAVLASIAAVAGAAFMLNKRMQDAQKEAMELGKALGSGTEAMKELSEFAGTVSAGEFMDTIREERLKGIGTAPGKTTFGEAFVQDEQGQALIEAAKTQMAQTGDAEATITALTARLSTAVMTGVLTKEQASSMAANLGFALNNMEIGLRVRANIAELTGPNGEDISADNLVEFAAKLNERSLEQVDKDIQHMNTNLEGVFGDDLSEMIGGSVAAGLGGAAAGAAAGALVGSIVPIFGTAAGALVGAGLGAIGGAVGGYFLMRDAAEEAGKLSGAVVASMVNALQQQQELSDAVDAYFFKKIEEAKVQGDITEQLRLQAEFEEKKLEMSEQEMAMREQMRGVLSGPGSDAARTGIDAAIETRFKDDADAQLILPAIEASLKDLDSADRDSINLELATGAISPQALNSLLTFAGDDAGQREAIVDIIGKFGGVFADETSQVLALIDDQELAADILVNISSSGNEVDAQNTLDLVREIQKQDAVFDTDVILRYVTENEEVAEELEDIFNRAELGVTSVTQAYEVNPELRNAEAFDALYFESLPDVDKEQYVKTISMILQMEEGEVVLTDDFVKWTGDEGQVHGPYPGRHSNAKWQRLYAESMGQKVTSALSSVDMTFEDSELEEEAGGGGGGPQASSLDELLKKLRDVRNSTIAMTKGWVDSRHALDKLFSDGGEIKIFQGIEQQMRKIGAGEDLISMIIGMDPEDYERRKHELFQFDNVGNIIGATTALQNMGTALRSIALGDFQSEQQRVIGGINEQLVAFRKLTAAGLSAAMAYEAIKDSAFASAVAREKDNSVIKETIRLTKQATEVTRAFQAAQSLARKNEQAGDLRGVIGFIERNARSLSEAQKSAILNDPDLQTLIMDPSVDPKTLRTALANASKQADLELRVKRLTFDGLQEIFQDGFSKAMEAFSAKEQEITLIFDTKKKPFLDIIQEAEEAISDIRNRAGGVDDLEADIERIARQEEEINKSYEDRIEALDKVRQANEQINQAQKDQLDVADALSRGDIAAAARASQAARASAAEAAQKRNQDILESQRDTALARLTGNMGLNREQLEKRVKDLQFEIFNIQENRLKPAQRQVELFDREQKILIESLEVLGKTRTEWEQIKNQIDLANVNSEKFQKAMQEALDVVEDIVTYWDDFDDKEIDLFVNVRQKGSVSDIEDVVQAGAPTPDPGSGGGGADREEILDKFVGRGAMNTVQGGTSLVDDARTPLPATRADMQLEEDISRSENKVSRIEEEIEERESKSFLGGRDTRENQDAIAALKLEKEQEEQRTAELQEKLNARQQERQQGDPMAIFNTGAANLMNATAFIFDNIARDAQGNITGNIGGYFRELGVNVPTLLSGIPGFFNLLPEDVKDNVQNGIAEQFKILAANVDKNLVGITNVFAAMPEDARVALQDKITPMLGEFALDGANSLENISEWWDDLPTHIQDEVRPLIQDQLLGLGEQAFTDLEGTLGQYWEVLPASVKDILEEQITPALREEAEKMGISVEELLLQKFLDMPEATREAITEGLASHWDTMQIQALQNIAGVGQGINQLKDIDPAVQRNIGNALRAAAEVGSEEFARVQKELSEMTTSREVENAFIGTKPGSLGALAQRGAELATTELDVIAETLSDIPEDPAVTGALGTDLPRKFGDSGRNSGNIFGTNAVTAMRARLAAANLSVTVQVKYDDPGPPGGNIGGFMGSGGAFLRNKGGMIPYAKGGMAKYGMGGIAKYMAGGVVGGFGNYDNVPAILTPGEFVIRREAVEKYGRNFFAALNSTIYNKKPSFSTPSFETPRIESSTFESSEKEKSPVMYNNNYSVSINVKSDSNADQIARTVIDQIKRIDSQRIRGNRL